MADILTAERDAVWKSIRGFEFLKGSTIDGTKFLRVMRWKETGGEVRWDPSRPPPLAQMPAISIRSVPGGEDAWELHQTKRLVHHIEIRLWTKYHNQDEPGELWKWIRRAIHQVPTAEATYLREASGVAVFNVTFPEFLFTVTDATVEATPGGQLYQTGGSPCTETTFTIMVLHEDNPVQDDD